MKAREVLLATVAGAMIGISATALCWVAGLQRNNLGTLFVVIWIPSTLSFISGLDAGKKSKGISPQKLQQAIGKVSERYALKPTHQDVLVALNELGSEVSDDNN